MLSYIYLSSFNHIEMNGSDDSMKHLTIAQVAKIAGVSKATLSRFLNGNFSHMSETTRKHIEETVKQLHYRPNRQAQTLKSRKSRLIGVMVDDISNIYSSLLLKGVGSICRSQNYQVLIMEAAGSLDLERDGLYRLIDQRIDGIIMQPISRQSESYRFLIEQQIPLVMVDRQTEPLTWPTVTADNFEVTGKLARYMIHLGYSRIIVVSQPVHAISSREQRYQAFKAVSNVFQTEVELVEIKHDSIAPLIERLKFLKATNKKKTALFAANSQVLTLILNYLLAAGVRIPEDIGVSGYDDANWAALAGPGITGIEQDPQKIGEVAANILLQAIAGQPLQIKNYIIPTKWTIRHSLQ
jgi:LacI family kdg operon repressor